MLVQRGEVVAVEGGVLQPLDRAEEEQFLGHGLPVGAHQVDLDVVAPGPVAADGRGRGQSAVGQQTGQGLTDQRFDRAAPPARPLFLDPVQGEVAPHPFDLRHVRIEEGQPEPQIGVGDPVAAFLGGPQREREVGGDHPLLDQQVGGPGERGVGDTARRARDIGEGPLARTDGPQYLPAHGLWRELRGQRPFRRDQQRGDRAVQGLAQELPQARSRPPLRADQRQSAGDQRGVEGRRRFQAEHLADVGGVEGPTTISRPRWWKGRS